MRILSLLVLIVAVVNGDVGYNYNAPQSSISLNTLGSQNLGISGESSGISQFFQSVSSPNLGPLNSAASFPQLTLGQGLPNVQSFGPTFSQGPPTVHKHIYVHVPPPEPQAPVHPIVLPPAQKHYKIIFVKIPSPPPPPSPVITQLLQHPQQEERTIVYVLVNKPQPAKPLPQAPPQQPSKPEVYFIKYNTQKVNSNENTALLGSGSSGNVLGIAPVNLAGLAPHSNSGSQGSSSNLSGSSLNLGSSNSQQGHTKYGLPQNF